MDKQALTNDLNASFKEWQEAIERFDETTFKAVPPDGGWSAAQIAEHLIVTEAAAVQALAGNTVANNRDAAAKVALIEAVMKDGTKRVAPVQVMPQGRVAAPLQAVELLNRQRQKLMEQINAADDLTNACVGIKHPALGTLTKWEWAQFILHHMRRHLRQIERLSASPQA